MIPRFCLPGAASGARLPLPENAAHHAKDVLRLRPGAEVRVFDGAGCEFHATIDEVSKRRVGVRVAAPSEPRAESALRLVLAISALRGDRMELVIQKAVELGVVAIRPFVSARTDSAARPALRGARRERWEKVAVGATEQCGRAVVPSVSAARPLRELLARPCAGPRLLLAERGPVAPLEEADAARPSAAELFVGPPGGFEDQELDLARHSGCRLVGLGPRILRTETAAIAALAILQARWGDLFSSSGG